jgi:hypothetical protein
MDRMTAPQTAPRTRKRKFQLEYGTDIDVEALMRLLTKLKVPQSCAAIA